METLEFRDEVIKTFLSIFGKREDCRTWIENQEVPDMNTDVRPIVMLEIVYLDSEQADLNEFPRIKDTGMLLVTVMVRELTGSRKAFELRSEARNGLQRMYFKDASTQVASLVSNTDVIKGWVGYRLEVPFTHYHF